MAKRIDKQEEAAMRDAYSAAEAKLAPLNERQRRFVWEYTVEPHATKAAIEAGYNERSAYSQAHDLLKKPAIQAALAAVRQGIEQRTAITAEMVVQELARVAFSDLGEAVTWSDAGMSFVDSEELPDRVRHAVKSITVKRKRMALPNDDGEMMPWELEEIGATMHEKVTALKLLGERYGVFDAPKLGETAPMGFIRAIMAELNRRQDPQLQSPE